MASGLFGLTLEKQLIDTLGESYEAEDNLVSLHTSAYTPNYDTHDFYNDLTNEVANGNGYTTGGQALTTTEITLSSGVLKFDADDLTWAASTITARKAVHRFNVGSASTDALGWCSEFAADASSAGGNFVIQWHVNGIVTIDYTP